MVEETSEFASSDLAGLLDQRFTKLESMVLEAQHFATEAATLFHPRQKPRKRSTPSASRPVWVATTRPVE